MTQQTSPGDASVSPDPIVTVYSRPACVQCEATKRAMTQKGIAFTAVDLTDNPDAEAAVTALGHRSLPVVVAGNEHWSGFQPGRIAGLQT
ncbi:glutaredoxin-like protein NrdH [Leisingera caerulea]|uniref:glutaredoxin-like protein NrdH n=1 Tax=Leisingera caerulea TaxID=506591 RepID=UPI00068428B3|nr:glutaredoxin-like protein NrdH [Leisingera caerulea]